MRRAAGLEWPVETLLLARLSDELSLLLWSRTEAAQRGGAPPSGVLPLLTGKDTEEKPGVLRGFESAAAFERAWKEG